MRGMERDRWDFARRTAVAAAAVAISTIAMKADALSAPNRDAKFITARIGDEGQHFVDRNASLSSQVLSFRELEAGWDGDDAVSPTQASIDAALAFLDLMPLGATPNAAMIESSGEVGYFWNQAHTYIDITFDGTNIVYYAKYLDIDTKEPAEVMGSKPFNGRSLPHDLLTALISA